MSRRNLIVAIDVGSAKTAVFVAQVMPDKRLQIISHVEEPSKGVNRGVIVNMEVMQSTIARVIRAATEVIGEKIKQVSVGVAGTHIRCRDSHGVVAVSGNEVQPVDVQRVLQVARAIPLEKNQQILHLIPKQFSVDEQPGVQQPIGMSAVRLETTAHLIIGAENVLQNLKKCLHFAGVKVNAFVALTLASSHSVLLEGEKDLGVVVVDIGAGTTDISVFMNGSICFTAVVKMAGNDVTRDLAKMLHTTPADAEQLKLHYGSADASRIDENETVEVMRIGSTEPSRISLSYLASVIQPRYEYILSRVQEQINSSDVSNTQLRPSWVFTGGAANIEHLAEMAFDYLGIEARIGYPSQLPSTVPGMQRLQNAAGIGLLLHTNEHQQEETLQRVFKRKQRPHFLATIKKMWAWLLYLKKKYL